MTDDMLGRRTSFIQQIVLHQEGQVIVSQNDPFPQHVVPARHTCVMAPLKGLMTCACTFYKAYLSHTHLSTVIHLDGYLHWMI